MGKYYFGIYQNEPGSVEYAFSVAYSTCKNPCDDECSDDLLKATEKVFEKLGYAEDINFGPKAYELEMCECTGGFNGTMEDAERVYREFRAQGWEDGDWPTSEDALKFAVISVSSRTGSDTCKEAIVAKCLNNPDTVKGTLTPPLTDEEYEKCLSVKNWKRTSKQKGMNALVREFDCAPLSGRLKALVITSKDDSFIMQVSLQGD